MLQETLAEAVQKLEDLEDESSADCTKICFLHVFLVFQGARPREACGTGATFDHEISLFSVRLNAAKLQKKGKFQLRCYKMHNLHSLHGLMFLWVP